LQVIIPPFAWKGRGKYLEGNKQAWIHNEVVVVNVKVLLAFSWRGKNLGGGRDLF
jgi:hypothetical protein